MLQLRNTGMPSPALLHRVLCTEIELGRPSRKQARRRSFERERRPHTPRERERPCWPAKAKTAAGTVQFNQPEPFLAAANTQGPGLITLISQTFRVI